MRLNLYTACIRMTRNACTFTALELRDAYLEAADGDIAKAVEMARGDLAAADM